MTERTLTAEGMSRGPCKAAVGGELGKLKGAERPDADSETGAAPGVPRRLEGD